MSLEFEEAVRIVVAGPIVGRDEQLVAVATFVESTRPVAAALLIEGEAGIGKTTIWREGVRLTEAAGGRVLACDAVESETKLSFCALGDLLEPIVDQTLPQLPAPRRRALEVALLRGDADGPPPDRRAVSLAALDAVRLIALTGPLTIAVDDVQWLDPSSARVLAFVLRRLRDAPVRLLGTVRIGRTSRYPTDLATAIADVRRVELDPLGASWLGALIRDRLGVSLSHPVLIRVHEASGGNPFYALEIARLLQDRGTPPEPGEPLAVPDTLVAVLRERIELLHPEARHALRLASALARPTVHLVTSAGGAPEGITEAERAGVTRVSDGLIEFVHPLFASTVYSEMTRADLRDVHRRLAGVVQEREESARHLALGADGPDAALASLLEAAAGDARSRGAPDAAADLLELSRRLTPTEDTANAARRARDAAGNRFDAGDAPRARTLLEEQLETIPRGTDRAELLFTLSTACWQDVPRVERLLQEALLFVGDDNHLRARVEGDLAWIGIFGGDLPQAAEHGRRALELAEAVEDRFPLRLALTTLGTAEFLMGRDSASLMTRAIDLEEPFVQAEGETPTVGLAWQLMWAGDLSGARQLLESDLRRRTAEGIESYRWTTLVHLTDLECRAGNWELADRYAAESLDITTDSGLEDMRAAPLSVRALVDARLGRVNEAREAAIEGLDVAEPQGDQFATIGCRSVLGFLELSLGNPREAHAYLASLPAVLERMGVREPGVFPFVPDEVEALVTLGELGPAASLTDRLEEQGRAQGRRLALATAARCRALISAALGDLAGAAVQVEQALEEHAGVAQPFELGRTLLVSGEVQRRMKRKKPARESLGQALAIFDVLGAPVWSARAGRELGRIGGRPPSPTGLTSTERQVAELVVRGGTNREVADALFVSVKTVEAHLRHIYQKVGVRSRTQLAHRLGPTSDPGVDRLDPLGADPPDRET